MKFFFLEIDKVLPQHACTSCYRESAPNKEAIKRRMDQLNSNGTYYYVEIPLSCAKKIFGSSVLNSNALLSKWPKHLPIPRIK